MTYQPLPDNMHDLAAMISAKKRDNPVSAEVVRDYSRELRNNFIVKYALANKTYSLFITCALLFSTPILTNMAGLRQNAPALQDLIKTICYPAMMLAGGLGYARESSKSTQRDRYEQDVMRNVTHMITRRQLANKAEKQIRGTLSVSQSDDFEIGALPFAFQKRNLNPTIQRPVIRPSSAAASVPVTNTPAYSNPEQQPEDSDLTSDVNRSYDFIHEIGTGKTHNNLLIFGQTGDQKSVTMNYALARWVAADPGLVTMVLDRKFYGSETDPKYKPVWSGLPVYEEADIFSKASYPFNSVFGKMYPDLDEWLSPVINLFNTRSEKGSKENDPLYDQIKNRHRPVLIILDDGTTLLDDHKAKNSQKKHDELLLQLTDLMTLGRTKNIFFWFVTHSTTATATGLPVTLLSQLNPIVGATIANNPSSIKDAKVKPNPEGIKLAAASLSAPLRGFATAWENYPYLPPAPLPKGTRSLLDPEFIVSSHHFAPTGFDIQDYQKSALRTIKFPVSKLGKISYQEFLNLLKDSPDISEESLTVNLPTSDKVEVQPELDPKEVDLESDVAMQQLRCWWMAHKYHKPSRNLFIRAIEIVFDVKESEAIMRFQTILGHMQSSDEQFAEAIFGKGAIPMNPDEISSDPTDYLDLNVKTRTEREN